MASQPGVALTAAALYIYIALACFGGRLADAATCECLGEEALERAFGPHAFANLGGRRCLPIETSSGIIACYPTNYGSRCTKWDDLLPSTCADMKQRRILHRPAWCSDSWCFVNASDGECGPHFPSAFFPNSGLNYSYQTCGSSNSFVDHVSQNHTTVTGMIRVISDYVKSSAKTMVTAWHKVDGSEVGDPGRSKRKCSVPTGCNCPTCVHQTAGPWRGSKVDFDKSIFYGKAGDATPELSEECMLESLHGGWEAAASKEGSKDRSGYLYAGLQSDGSCPTWPAVEWCPVSVDFRFRPWYATAASGPKDVVLVIDCSGSMGGEREELARAASTAVIDTLVDVDYATVVGFDCSAKAWSTRLNPMTDSMKQGAKNWIARYIVAGGGTCFRTGFTKAFDILKASRAEGKTAGCKTLMLFLSDGDPADWSSGHRRRNSFSWLKATNEEAGDTVIFTYALGSGLSARGLAINKRIACENRGIFHHVSGSTVLGSVMANYYMYMGVGADSATVRWRDYSDAITGKRLLTGCVPAFDKRALPRKLIGVSCMDINTLVDLPDLEATDGYADFSAEVINQQSYCAPFRLSHWDIQMLRNEFAADSVCDVPSGINEIVCGDGIVDAYPHTGVIEYCDDGNVAGGDGCSAMCRVEEGWVCPKYGYVLLSGDFNGFLKRPNVYCHGRDYRADGGGAVGSTTSWNWCRQHTSRSECSSWCRDQGNCSAFNWYDEAWGITNACCFRESASTKEYHTNTECFEKTGSGSQTQCLDLPGFVDEQNYKCHEWVGYQCDAATTDYGYSAVGQKTLVDNCPSSCGICAGHMCHVACSVMVDTVDACPDCRGEYTPWGECHHSKIHVVGDKLQCLQERAYNVTKPATGDGAACPVVEGANESKAMAIFQLKEWKEECVRPDSRGAAACGAGVRERTVECIAEDPMWCNWIQNYENEISEVIQAQCFTSAGCFWQLGNWSTALSCYTGYHCESAFREDCGEELDPDGNGCYTLPLTTTTMMFVAAAHSKAWLLSVLACSLLSIWKAVV